MEKLNKLFSRRKQLLIPALVVLILLISLIGGVSAKYVKDVGGTKALVRAKEFYFSSDLLAENGAHYDLNPGTTSVTFELRNHDDQLRFSEEPVEYKVTADNGATVSSTPDKLTAENPNATITLSGLQDGKTYTVTAVGSAGYKKTLTATFTVKAQSEGVYKHLNVTPDASGTHILLTVWTENTSGDVTIQFPAGLIPDATDPALAGILNCIDGTYRANTDESGISQAAGSLGSYSSHTYRFFLEELHSGSKFSVEHFKVFIGGREATNSNPK